MASIMSLNLLRHRWCPSPTINQIFITITYLSFIQIYLLPLLVFFL